MNDQVHINDATARPGVATDNVNIQDSASHAYSAAGQADFLKASASGKDTSAASLPNFSLSNDSQSGGGGYQNIMDDPYTRMAVARIFNFSAPSSAGGDTCTGGGGIHSEPEEAESQEAPRVGPDGKIQATVARPRSGGNSTVRSMMQAERAGNVAHQSQARSVAP